jgi:hypothetical protein
MHFKAETGPECFYQLRKSIFWYDLVKANHDKDLRYFWWESYFNTTHKMSLQKLYVIHLWTHYYLKSAVRHLRAIDFPFYKWKSSSNMSVVHVEYQHKGLQLILHIIKHHLNWLAIFPHITPYVHYQLKSSFYIIIQKYF